MHVPVKNKILHASRCLFNGWTFVSYLSQIHIARGENDAVKPQNPLFYRRFVDNIINRRRKNQHDIVFQNLNSYYQDKFNYRSKSRQVSGHKNC